MPASEVTHKKSDVNVDVKPEDSPNLEETSLRPHAPSKEDKDRINTYRESFNAERNLDTLLREPDNNIPLRGPDSDIPQPDKVK